MAIDIGRIAYQTYCDSLKLTSHSVSLRWEDIGKERQDAWRSSAVAVLQYIRKEQESLDDSID